MRILQVVHGFPPNEWTGTELVTLHLAQALRERGHEVSVLTRVYDSQSAEGTVREANYEHLRVFQLVNNYTRSGSFRLLYDNPLFNRPFLQVLDRVRPDVVHFQHTQHLSVSLLRLAPALGYPTVLSLHDFFFACHRVQLLDVQQRLCSGPEQGQRCVACLQETASAEEARRRFTDMERVLRAPDVVITPSAFLADKMRGYFPFLANRLRAISLGIESIPGSGHTRLPRASGAPLRILYVGVLAPHKGAHVLLEALNGLPHDHVEVSLYGVEWSHWQTYIEQLHAAARELPVRFCGTYTRDQLGDILMQHDVLVMPMIWEETFSILVREAFLTGLPVIAARRGALIEAVQDGENGLLFEPENAAELHRCLQRLLDEPELLDQLGKAVPRVKTMDEYTREVETIYTEVCQQASLCVRSWHTSAGRTSPQSLLQNSCATVQTSTVPTTNGNPSPVKVSVCIPTYNGSAFLAEAMKSVLEQSFHDFELLIVDDGSTDTTLDIARSFSDSRIMIHRNEKQLGIPGNWNRCLELARGDYICIFHQDDVMLPTNLEHKLGVLQSDAAVRFVHSAIELLTSEDNVPPPTNWVEPATEDFVSEGTTYFRRLLLYGNRICAPSVMTRRALLLELGGFDEELGFAPDYEMWLKMCVEGKVAFLSRPLVQYRWHAQNASHSFRFLRGVEEIQTASQKAIRYYADRTGQQERAAELVEIVDALSVLRRWTRELEQGKEWLDEQRTSWLKMAQERETALQEQKAWTAELERGKIWLEEQRVSLQDALERQDRSLQLQAARMHELEQWIAELEKGKQWLEEQWHIWQAEAVRWQAEAQGWRKQWWNRAGMRLGVVHPAHHGGAEPSQESKG